MGICKWRSIGPMSIFLAVSFPYADYNFYCTLRCRQISIFYICHCEGYPNDCRAVLRLLAYKVRVKRLFFVLRPAICSPHKPEFW